MEMNDNKEEESRTKGTIRPELAVQPVRRCGWFLIQVTAPEFHRWTVLSMECMMDVIRISMMKSTFFSPNFFLPPKCQQGAAVVAVVAALTPNAAPSPPFREVALLTFSIAKVQLLSFCVFQPPPDTGITQHWQNLDVLRVLFLLCGRFLPVGICWLEFFPSARLWNGCTDPEMSEEAPLTRRRLFERFL